MPMLDVGQGHTMYYETHGNPRGRPVVVLHGGPGGGLQRFILKLFDLRRWFVVLYDQRGCGKSTPRLELKDNTTWHLVDDMETLRKHLKIETWALYGGSWGTTLALAYASKHLERASAFIFKGACIFTDEENRWLFEKGYASETNPQAWANVVKPLRKGTRKLIAPYHRLLSSAKTRKTAATAWAKYESNMSFLNPEPFKPNPKSDEESAVLESHYFMYNAWLTPALLLKAAKKIKVPLIIVQGKYDMVCPTSSATQIKEAVPHAKLYIIPNAGHATKEKGIFIRLKKEIRKLSM